MSTDAYQRSSARPEAAVQVDPDNRLLARFDRRRLAAEEIRDSLLSVSGQLDVTPAEAHPFPPEGTWKFTQHNPFNAVYPTNKRSAYLMVQRQRRHPFLALFDGADPNASTPLRQTTTIPSQALFFLNDPFFHAQAAQCAASWMKLPDDAARVAQAFRAFFQREPSAAERGQAWQFIADYPAAPEEKWSAYARVLLAANEHGLRAVEKPVHVHDFHATILQLMGFDHEKLTCRHAGRDYRLTDVEGRVVNEVLA